MSKNTTCLICASIGSSSSAAIVRRLSASGIVSFNSTLSAPSINFMSSPSCLPSSCCVFTAIGFLSDPPAAVATLTH